MSEPIESVEAVDAVETEPETKEEPALEPAPPKPLSKKALDQQRRQQAIDLFERGQEDPEFKVIKDKNGKYRCTKRKEILPPEPIQIQDPEISKQEKPAPKPKSKPVAAPSSDQITYYNLSNQVSEQLSRRVDELNKHVEKLQNKQSKMKGKYRKLKESIYEYDEEEPKQINITDEEAPVQRRQTSRIDRNKYFK